MNFTQTDLATQIDDLAAAELNRLEFGVIGFDSDTVVQVYNSFESDASGMSPERVVGQRVFTIVAPCMNNFMVAQRFEDAAAQGVALDMVIDYVLTFRMRPVKVQLRLVAALGMTTRYIFINRLV